MLDDFASINSRSVCYTVAGRVYSLLKKLARAQSQGHLPDRWRARGLSWGLGGASSGRPCLQAGSL